MGLRMPELLIIFAVLLLLFGASRLPQLGGSLGSAIRNFKRGFGSDEKEKTEEAPSAASLSASQSVQADTKSEREKSA